MDASKPLAVRVGPKSHIGKVRTEQQDRMTRFKSAFGDVFVVADGMGGHEGGATAAHTVVTRLQDYLQDLPPSTPLAEALQSAARRCNAELHERAHGGDPKVKGMGATVVLAVVEGRRFVIAHAGDSRAYLLRGARLQRLTKDHTRMQRMVDAGVLSEEEARRHPDASVVTRALGAEREVEFAIADPVTIEDRDVLLLCSDGLSGYVEDAQIEAALATQPDPQAAAAALIALGLSAGGEDNITVQVIQFGERASEALNPRRGARAALLRWIVLALLVTAGAVALVAALRRSCAGKCEAPSRRGVGATPVPAPSAGPGIVRPSPVTATPAPDAARQPTATPAQKRTAQPRHE